MGYNPLTRLQELQKNHGLNCTLQGCNHVRDMGHLYCPLHRTRVLFRGDVHQTLISQKEKNFAYKTVQFLIKDNENNPAYINLLAAIGDNWLVAHRTVDRELQLSADGTPMNRLRRKGLHICKAIFTKVSLVDAFTIYCGMQFLWAYNPNMFVSDIAFRHILVRTLRSKAKDFASFKLNKLTGEPTSRSSPLFEKERDIVWEIFSGVFGTTGMRLHEQLTKRAERLQRNKMSITKALKDIT